MTEKFHCNYNLYFCSLSNEYEFKSNIPSIEIEGTTYFLSDKPFLIKNNHEGKNYFKESKALPCDRVARLLDTYKLKYSQEEIKTDIYFCEILGNPEDRRKLNVKKVFENKPDQLLFDNIYKFLEPLYVHVYLDKDPFAVVSFVKNEDKKENCISYSCDLLDKNNMEAVRRLALPYLQNIPEYKLWLSK